MERQPTHTHTRDSSSLAAQMGAMLAASLTVRCSKSPEEERKERDNDYCHKHDFFLSIRGKKIVNTQTI